MSRKKLTAKQHDFLQFLKQHKRDTGVWPTYREITDHFGYRSPNSVTQNLKALCKKGYLVYDDEKGYQFAPGHAPQEAGIPVKGVVSAGTLQDAADGVPIAITLDLLFSNLEQVFAVRMEGQSLQSTKINDGDYLLLVDEDIPEGELGAVLYDGKTMLRHIYHEEEGLRLEPASEEHDALHVQAETPNEEVQILGRYVGHVNERGIFKRRPQERAGTP